MPSMRFTNFSYLICPSSGSESLIISSTSSSDNGVPYVFIKYLN